MNYGVTVTGFVRKHFATIKDDIETALQAEFGDDINLAIDSVFGKIVGVMSQPLADLWELGEEVYNAMYPPTADGVNLDNSSALVGVERSIATPSEVVCALRGSVGTVIPAASIAATEVSEDQFQLITAVTLSASVATRAAISVDTLATGAYNITINSTVFGYGATVPPDDDDEIFNQLETLIDAGAEPVDADYTPGDGIIYITGDLDADLLPTPFLVSVTANLNIDLIDNLGDFESVEHGPIIANANTLNQIVTPINHWNSLYNPKDAELGDTEETDSEYRIRRADSLATAGAGTVEALRAKLLAVTDVDSAFVMENTTDAVVDSVPAHGFEAVVLDGDDDDIAAAIWENKPAGIATYGHPPNDVDVVVTDTQGFEHHIYFSRPDEIDIEMEIDYHKLPDGEGEIFPSDGEALIASTALTWGQAHVIGQDVLPDRAKTPIFAAVTGIAYMAIRVKEVGVGGFVTTEFPIAFRDIAIFDSANIKVTEV